jgi:Protein of unknown function (DUF2892)
LKELDMKTNEGGLDRTLRVLAGVILVGLAAMGTVGTGPLAWLAGLVGVILLGTGLISWCPIYAVLGLNTCPMKKSA